MMARSTPPNRPAYTEYAGVPSTAASRFMLPPALMTASAPAIALGPSRTSPRHEQFAEASRLELARLLERPRQHERRETLIAGQPP